MSLPKYVRAMLQMLSGGASPDLTGEEWKLLLHFADRTQCTLFLRPSGPVPAWFEESLEKRRAANRLRRARLKAEYQEVSAALCRAGVEFVLLKSFTHEIEFGFDGEDRVQYDIDLLCQDCAGAFTALRALSYEPVGTRELSEIHEKPLTRRTSWTWRGDYYDPEMPIAVELHNRLWSGDTDRLPLPETQGFWHRREWLDVAGIVIPALCEVDRVAFAALHVLRHALHHSMRISHVWELARVLQYHADDSTFWNAWGQTHGSRSRLLQSTAMRFAEIWFGAPLPQQCGMHVPAIEEWFRNFAYAPLENLVSPNKNVVWLHKELVEGRWDRFALVSKALVPLKVPEPGRALERILYHARALVPALAGRLRLRSTSSSASQTSEQ